ncbi:MAG: hypothetical protein ACTSSP_10150 [Candidatus Asgardarchaeia archaeon]
MSYLYRIGHTSEEESDTIELSHPNYFTKKTFNQVVIDAVMDVLLREKDKDVLDYEEGEIREKDLEWMRDWFKKSCDENGVFAGHTSVEDYIDICGYRWYSTFSDIFEEIAEKLVEKYGFSFLEYTQEVFANGWGGIVDKDRQFGKEEVILNIIRDKFWEEKGEV